ncbi:PREDICTED: phosphatidylinositol 4-kinase gamma 4-like [Fragaria vesca subsp. vesca]|uniref:phosphatidylinositol 4-kinase gamma 4-like n=1 Tax=Fragaria vesca subsp. vesca TaxID=101020 RepID=UPI0002C31DC1|nr:PREDICTED: phosphatidylinositol 4-kinase gamma 4-like [Fragaria vesca subsp. vesca]
MELKHEREIKRQTEVQIKAKDLEIAMLTQERVKKIKRDWWLWGTIATTLTIGAACLAYSNPSGSEKEDISVFKPVDEEIGAVNNPRRGRGGSVKVVVVGEGVVREVASYLLDYPQSGYRRSYTDEIGFSGVPPTIMVECLHENFNGKEKRKRGSLQKYMVSKGDCEGYGNNKFSELSEHEVHKISVLDIRLTNADRHLGNLLLSTEEDQLIPIDHGCCIPENFERCRFNWIGWSQCKKAYSQETLNYIRKINPDEDIKYLQAHGLILSDESQQTLRISSMILKQGAQYSDDSETEDTSVFKPMDEEIGAVNNL